MAQTPSVPGGPRAFQTSLLSLFHRPTVSAIRTELNEHVLTITLHRPNQLNAFTVGMGEELIHAFDGASENDAVRAVIVTGDGRAFCAGMDLTGPGNVFGLNETMSPTLADLQQRPDDPMLLSGVRDKGGLLTLAIFRCKKPVIAAVNGPAVGVGATMTLAMDVRFASDRARFGFVFGRIGIVPDACSSWFLPKVVGLPKALEWVYSGELVSASEAHRCGLVSEVLPADELLARAHRYAHVLVHERSPVSVALTRQMMYRLSSMPDPWQAHLVETMGEFHASQHDGREGVRAFLEKRPPQFAERASRMPDFYPWWDGPV